MVKGFDNSFYLNHNFLKKESKASSIFIDCNVVNEFQDRNTLIYGHYMKDGSMFADLHKLYYELDNSFNIYVATESEINTYQIFSIFKDSADINNYQYFWSTNDDYLSFLSTMKSKSIYDYCNDINEFDIVLTLSTCDFNYKNGRLLVYFRKA